MICSRANLPVCNPHGSAQQPVYRHRDGEWFMCWEVVLCQAGATKGQRDKVVREKARKKLKCLTMAVQARQGGIHYRSSACGHKENTGLQG